MGVRVIMELDGDNDHLHAERLTQFCEAMDREFGPTVQECILTTGKVTVEEEFEGSPLRRPQIKIR